MKQIALAAAIKSFDTADAGYTLRVYLTNGQTLEGPHNGYEAGHSLVINSSNSNVAHIDVDAIVAVEALY